MNKALVLISIVMTLAALSFLAGYLFGFTAGKNLAEDQFCDKYLNDEKEANNG